MDSSIAIIGSKGQLGTALQIQYPASIAVDQDELDITNQNAVDNFDWSNVKTIINAAAYTNVDGAETPAGRQVAWQVNAIGAANLARLAADRNMCLIHISTDYVFDGTNQIHSEDEPFSPLSVYGSSKAAGDLAVSLVPKHYLLRTSWVIGEGKNFVRTMLGLGEKGVSPTVIADQVGRLTFTDELVRAVDHLLTSSANHGTYNVSNDGETASWADITRAIFELAGYTDLTVTDSTTADYFAGKDNVIAPRPLQSTLDLAKIHQTGFSSTDWRKALANYIQKEITS